MNFFNETQELVCFLKFFKKITAPKWNRNLSSYFTVFKGTITLL